MKIGVGNRLAVGGNKFIWKRERIEDRFLSGLKENL